MAGEDKKLIAEMQELYTDFEKKFNSDPSKLLNFLHKDFRLYVSGMPESEVRGPKDFVDYISNKYPYYLKNSKVTHAELLTPRHVLCDMYQDNVEKHDEKILAVKAKLMILWERNEAGKWVERTVYVNACTKDAAATRKSAAKPRGRPQKEPGDPDADVWNGIQNTMDAASVLFNYDTHRTGHCFVKEGRLYPTGQPISVGREDVGRGNATLRKEGWLQGDLYPTFVEKLSDEYALVLGNFKNTNEKTGEVIYSKVHSIFKKVDGLWLFRAAAF